MAAQEGPEDPPAQHLKTWVLKVSIHCEGCKRKVNKILRQVRGVHTIDIDLKQQKATVTGNVEAETLLRNLHKSGKHAELLLPPQQSQSYQKEKKSTKSKNKEKQIAEPENKAAATTSQHKDVPTAKVVVAQEPTKRDKPSTGPVKPVEETGGEPVAKGNEGGSNKGSIEEAVNESKSEGKKPVADSAGKQRIPVVAAEKKGVDSDNAEASGEKSGGGPEVEASGNSGKKKKKKGQNSNNTDGPPSSVGPAGTEFQHHNVAPEVTNDGPPRQPGYHYYAHQGPHYYAPPPAYVVSYNTAQPTSSYTASYYAPAPPTSYAYTYSGPGPVTQPAPSDVQSYPPQPLESFEMFSDENPNGCFIM